MGVSCNRCSPAWLALLGLGLLLAAPIAHAADGELLALHAHQGMGGSPSLCISQRWKSGQPSTHSMAWLASGIFFPVSASICPHPRTVSDTPEAPLWLAPTFTGSRKLKQAGPKAVDCAAPRASTDPVPAACVVPTVFTDPPPDAEADKAAPGQGRRLLEGPRIVTIYQV